MAVAEQVIVDLIARTENLERGFDRARQESGALSKVFGQLKGALAGIGAVAAARELLQLADASKSIDAQLRLATATFGTFNQAQKDSRDIAAATRSGLQETATLYGNFARATQALGGNQTQAARATETFSKALKIGGADANAAASATLQFGQALASGALRGDEFNSIAEASPRILKLIADAMGTTQGAVRGLAAEGKLTSDILFKALTDRKFTAGIDSEFQQLPVTFDQAMGQVRNAAIVTFGAFDQGGQFSTALANFITGGANGFADLEAKALEFGQNTRAVIEGLSNVFDPLQANGNAVFDALGIKIFSVSEQIRSLLGSIDNVRNFLPDLQRGAQQIDERIFGRRTGNTADVGPRADSAGDFARGQRLSLARSRRDAAARRLEGAGFIVPRDAAGNVIESEIRRRPAAPPPPRTPPKTKAKKGPKGRSAESIALEAEREQQAFDNDLASINDRILDAKQALATAADVVAQYERDSIEIARTRYNDQQNSLVAQKKRTRAQADTLIALNDERALLQKKLVDQREEQRKASETATIAQAGFRTEQELLQSRANIAQSAAERKSIELRLVDLAYDQEKAALDAVLASKASTEAERKIAEARLRALPELRDNAKAEVEERAKGRFERYRDDLKSADALQDGIDGVKIQTLEAITDELTNATKAALGLKGAFGDIVGELIRIGIQRRLIGPLADALFGKADGSSSGGIGSIFSAIASGFKTSGGGFGGGRASGGDVTAGRLYKINENGPELFQPAQSGKIYPTGSLQAKMGGQRGNTIVQQTFTLDARGGITTPELLRYVNTTARREAATAGKAAYQASPQRVNQFQTLGS